MGQHYDIVVIGAGIVGLATAMKLTEIYPELRTAVVEKEASAAAHQTGHNSGVIHSGIYYKPGSLKSKLCVSGSQELIRFCREHSIPFELCGKIVIATEPDELPWFHELYRRGAVNGIPDLKLIDPSEVREIEPHSSCIQGLRVPGAGIVDYAMVANAYARLFQQRGGELFFNHKLLAIHHDSRSLRLETSNGSIDAAAVINCAGLYADRVALLAGASPPCRIVPFRGEYYQVKPQRRHLVKNLLYPVPDPRFPFLGVHFTRMIDGRVEAGPNAVLAWAREGYRKTDFNASEMLDTLGGQGFWKLAIKYWRPGMMEMMRSYSKKRFAIALQRLIPEIAMEDLAPGGAGVRAQALAANGSLLDDFSLLLDRRMLHVLNAPSPAATSSLAIAEYLIRTASPMIGSNA